MSILRPMNESAGRVRRSTGRRSANANDAVWRAELLSLHRDALDRLVSLLLEKEVVDGTDVYAIVGRDRPAGPEAVEAPALNGQHARP
jgi:hypothetical protein